MYSEHDNFVFITLLLLLLLENSGLVSKIAIRDHSIITSAKRWLGWGGQILMFTDKVGGWGRPNADMSKK